jgi:hypothetical protein
VSSRGVMVRLLSGVGGVDSMELDIIIQDRSIRAVRRKQLRCWKGVGKFHGGADASRK